MNRAKRAKDGLGETYVSFLCPGCEDHHTIPITGPKAWGFNGSFERPTITPSIRTRYYEGETVEAVCHSVVTDGRIAFAADSTHKLKGQTVDLADIVEDAS